LKLNQKKIGVSVTRAMHYRGDEYFTIENATFLLQKKNLMVFSGHPKMLLKETNGKNKYYTYFACQKEFLKLLKMLIWN